MNKNKNLSELMSYAGKYKYLTGIARIVGCQCGFSAFAVYLYLFCY